MRVTFYVDNESKQIDNFDISYAYDYKREVYPFSDLKGGKVIRHGFFGNSLMAHTDITSIRRLILDLLDTIIERKHVGYAAYQINGFTSRFLNEINNNFQITKDDLELLIKKYKKGDL